MPVRVTAAGLLDTEGLASGAALGLRTFVDQVAAGSLDVGGAALDGMVTNVAVSLERDRRANAGRTGSGVLVRRPLTKALLDTNGDGSLSAAEVATPITRALLLARLQVLLPSGVSDLNGASGERIVALVNAFVAELSASATDPDQAAVATQAFEAMLGVFRDAVVDAGNAFLDVADPSLSIDGAVQPVILGLPIGGPDDQVGIRITKGGIDVRLTTSLNRIIEVMTGGVGLIYTQTFGKILNNHVTLIAELPVEGALRTVVNGGAYPRATWARRPGGSASRAVSPCSGCTSASFPDSSCPLTTRASCSPTPSRCTTERRTTLPTRPGRCPCSRATRRQT